jgi:hypothetical protein
MQRHRLPSKLSTVIGEPGHTKPHAAGAGPGEGIVVFFGCALLSTLIEGLPIPLKTGNRPSQP